MDDIIFVGNVVDNIVYFCHIPREENKAAHAIATLDLL